MSGQHLILSLVNSLADSCWIAALLWLVFRLVGRLFPLQPIHNYRLAGGLVYLLFVVWLISFLVYGWGDAGLSIHLSLTGAIRTGWSFPTWVMNLFAVLYFTGLCFHLIRYGYASKKLSSLMKESFGLPDTWQTVMNERANQLTIRRTVIGRATEKLASPLTFGWIRPVILFPVALLNQLNYNEVESIILHELAHIRRNDYLHQQVFAWMEMVLFFNPFARDLFETIRQEREKSCDDEVLQSGKQPVDYATALLWCARNTSAFSGGLQAVGREGDLLIRVRRITGQPVRREKSAGYLVMLALVWIGLGTQVPFPAPSSQAREKLSAQSSGSIQTIQRANLNLSSNAPSASIDKGTVAIKRKSTRKLISPMSTSVVTITIEPMGKKMIEEPLLILTAATEQSPQPASILGSLQQIRGLSRPEIRELMLEVINGLNQEEKITLAQLLNRQYLQQRWNSALADSSVLLVIPGYIEEHPQTNQEEIRLTSKLLLLMAMKWQEKNPKGIESLIYRQPTDSISNQGKTEQ